MHTIYRIILALHVVGGALGLSAMAIPLLSGKGARLHRITGWAFAGGMGLSASTGIMMACAWGIAPAMFQPHATPFQARLDGMFLALIGLLTGNALIQAISAVRRKQSSTRASSVTRWSLAVLFAAALVSITLGVLYEETLSFVFGLGSLALAIQDLVFTLRPLRSPMAWWYQHMNAMGIACISAVTAFLVLGARRWLDSDVLGGQVWVLWIAPSLIFVPLFQVWIIAYRRKFEARPLEPRRAQEVVA